jgi:hypothetical protein
VSLAARPCDRRARFGAPAASLEPLRLSANTASRRSLRSVALRSREAPSELRRLIMLDSTLQRWAVPARMSTAAALAALGLMLFLALALASAPRADAVQFCNVVACLVWRVGVIAAGEPSRAGVPVITFVNTTSSAPAPTPPWATSSTTTRANARAHVLLEMSISVALLTGNSRRRCGRVGARERLPGRTDARCGREDPARTRRASRRTRCRAASRVRRLP